MNLNTLMEPQLCPICANAEIPRVGFLRKILTEEEANHFINNTINFECMTCHALFEVDNEL